jgi:hypothetical protein
MDRPTMKFRKLRVAWAIACGIACVLLLYLWIRSYWRWDELIVRIPTSNKMSVLTNHIEAISLKGRIRIHVFTAYGNSSYLEFTSFRVTNFPAIPNWSLGIERGHCSATCPHWFAIMLAAASISLSRIRPSTKFSLRTLLIATTLVAVGTAIYTWVAQRLR